SLDSSFRSGLEETSPGAGLADLIARRWTTITRVRLFLISNRLLSAKVDGRSADAIEHATVTFSVWDIERLHRFVVSGRGREPIQVELSEFGGPIPALPAHLDGAGYEAYLLVVPGKQLAGIYDRWGARLLEQNVRCFLQARGNVNKGIRNTIEVVPEMFFAYNNGITATAEGIETAGTAQGMVITQLNNLQIVNGGQTTASIHAASRRKDVDLGRVFVQMKLSIIPPSEASDVVPRISEYANSQNRVKAADFFANHPFHIRIEEFSRRIFAPSPDGTFRETKWFYERAHGQYQDARALLTIPQKRKFDLEYPKKQMFTKTDLAKFLNVWTGQPHIVSQGAQKNFAHFAESVGKEWDKQSDRFNERFYREAIAKAILFQELEKLIPKEAWYQGGYRANVVAYTLAKLSHDLAGYGRSLDFEKIWRTQGVSYALRKTLLSIAETVHKVITDPPRSISNVTEWAKKLGCWQSVMDLKIEMHPLLSAELMGGEEQRQATKSALKEQKLLNGIEAQLEVVNRGGEFWARAREWGVGKKCLSVTELDLLSVASSVPTRIPTERQSLKVIDALEKLRLEGFQP
ncbi:MAG TPA: AIPR family protein, partial [Longimicrobium sp.]|nr:AIPR family protein [Longimicrobium sp.]